jgi:hypothetical protein
VSAFEADGAGSLGPDAEVVAVEALRTRERIGEVCCEIPEEKKGCEVRATLAGRAGDAEVV